MSESADPTVQLLREIRDAIHQNRTELSARLDLLASRVDETRAKLSARFDEVASRLDETRTEISGQLLELSAQQRFLVRHFTTFSASDRHLSAEVDELRRRVDNIERRIPPQN